MGGRNLASTRMHICLENTGCNRGELTLTKLSTDNTWPPSWLFRDKQPSGKMYKMYRMMAAYRFLFGEVATIRQAYRRECTHKKNAMTKIG